jgi:hypothetical protein
MGRIKTTLPTILLLFVFIYYRGRMFTQPLPVNGKGDKHIDRRKRGIYVVRHCDDLRYHGIWTKFNKDSFRDSNSWVYTAWWFISQRLFSHNMEISLKTTYCCEGGSCLPGGKGHSLPSVSWLSTKCQSFDISQPYGPPRPLTEIALLIFSEECVLVNHVLFFSVNLFEFLLFNKYFSNYVRGMPRNEPETSCEKWIIVFRFQPNRQHVQWMEHRRSPMNSKEGTPIVKMEELQCS